MKSGTISSGPDGSGPFAIKMALWSMIAFWHVKRLATCHHTTIFIFQ
jgi:hypothetical protein